MQSRKTTVTPPAPKYNLAIIGASFVCGITLGWFLPNLNRADITGASGNEAQKHTQANTSTSENQTSNNASTSSNTPQASPIVIRQNNGVQAEQDKMQRLIEHAQRDPNYRKQLLQSFKTMPTGANRDTLFAVLVTLQTPDVMAFSKEMIKNGDSMQRKNALELIAATGNQDPAVRDLVKNVLSTEKDPQALALALTTLKPNMADSNESTAITQQVQNFARHENPTVRGQAIEALGRWDKTGESIPMIQQSLQDTSIDVKRSAINAITENNLRSDGLKHSLLGIINNPSESLELKIGVAYALNRYALTADETAAVKRVIDMAQNGTR